MDGKKLTFDLAGLIGSNFVLRDHQTGSRWQQATGECFDGPMKGRRLAMVPFLLTTWQEWRAQHPLTLVLVPESNLTTQYQRMEQTIASFSMRRPPRGGVREDSRLPPMERVLGLEAGGGYKAYREADLKQQGVVNDRVGSLPVALVYSPAAEMFTAFARTAGGRVLRFRRDSTDPLVLVDEETGSRWNAYGECLSGELKGARLNAVTPLPSFWFSWAEFFPQTELYLARQQPGP